MTLTLDMIGDYISSGATGWVFEHNQEPDKVIKIMKAFPQVGNTVLDAFQYHNYLQDRHIVRYNPAHNEYDHTWSVGMLWRPMSAKMQMYMFDELMSAQRSGGSIPTGFVKLYDSVKTFLPLNFTKDIYAEIATQDQDHADAWEDNFLSVRGPGHRNAYIISMEKLNLSKNVSGNLRPRKEVFAEVAGYLWDNLNLVTRDTAVAGNYGYRANKELVIFDPIVAPLPTYEEWRPSLAPNNVYDRLRYNYFSYLFTEEPFPVESLDEARHVNRAIRKIERQLSNNTFTTVERDAESFAVEGFPGSELDGTSLNDWSVRDLMYSNSVTGNFLEDQAKFNYGLNAESMYRRDSIYELYLRMPSGKEEILSRQDNFNLALAQMCGLILGNKVVYEIGIYGPRLADPYYSKDLLVRHKYGEFTGNDPDAVRMARDNCLQPKGFDSGFQEEFEAPAPKQTKVKFPRAKADKIVTKVENHLRPMVEKMMACGSYRRGAQMIGDIDFVVIPKEGYTLPNMLPPNEGINWVGENKAQVIIDGEKVDFKVTTPAAWCATILYFTGPADFNIKYRWMAKRKGLKLSEYGLFDRNTEQYLAGATETDIFTALGRPYKDPAQRQGFSKSKKKTTKKAEEIRCCKECDKTTGLTTIQTGTYCYDCLPINLGAEDNYDATYGVKQAKIRRKLKKSIKKQNTHGTKAGQWSARKSQLLKQKYEAACERKGLRAYKGKKTSKQNDLSNWSKQKWGTASGKKSSVTGEPYFPAGAVKALKKQGLYAKATRQKRAATKAGKQRASYSKDIQNIVSDYRAESEQGPICPICYNYIPTNENPGAYPGALARYDNKTEICSDCGTSEALAGMMAGPEAIAEWESSERTWRDYQILIMTTKSNIPEIMFGRGPELEQLRELQKKMDNKKSETLVEEVFQRRYGWNVEGEFEENRRLRNSEFPMAINLGEHNFERPFQGLGSLFGAESKDSKVFGVQRHDAHRAGLHYDLRLERDGVLKSWSIPKGMPTDNRHLAIATDDHAMSWLDFDGDIPDGTYGAGKVSLDNKSTFQTVSYSPKKWVFYVNSGKYEGKYTLVHWQDNKWLISRNKNQSMEAETREFNAWYDLATDKQRDYIKRLGGDPHPDLNRRQASKLINQLARMKRALDQIDVVVDEEPYDAEDTFVSRDYPPCYLCGKPAKLDVMTAVGRRQFCNNRCRGEYEGVDYGEYPSEELEHSLEIVEYYPGFSDYDYVEESTIDIRCRNCDWRTSQHHQEPTHTWDSTKQSFYRLHPTNTLPVFDEDGDFETYEECKHDMYIIKYLGREEYEDSLDPRSGNIVVGCRKCNFKDLLDHVDIPAGCSNRGQDKPKDFSRFFGSEYNWDDIEWTTTDRKPIEDWQDVSWEDNKYISATGIFYSPNGRIGLQLRSQQVLSPNTWSGISGFLDADETPYETVVREIHEESGLPLDKIKSWKYKVIWDNKVHRTYLFYTDTEFKPIVNEFKWEWDDWHWDTNEAWKQVPNLHPGMVAALEVIQ